MSSTFTLTCLALALGEIIEVPYPDDFVTGRISQKRVRETIQELYPGSSDSFPTLPEHGTLLLRAPIPEGASPFHPPYVGIRVDNVLGKEHRQYLAKKFNQMATSGLPHLLKPDTQRSANAAWHLGIWSITARRPRLTAESKHHDPVVQQTVDDFLGAVKRHVAPLINALLRTYAPKVWLRQQR
jgi:hypothetical protein